VELFEVHSREDWFVNSKVLENKEEKNVINDIFE